MCKLPSLPYVAVAAVTMAAASLAAQNAAVRGTVTVLERGNRAASDVDEAVVWLVRERPGRQGRPDTMEITARRREFLPHVAVVTPGDAVRFPNADGFNHNVFSLSAEGPFDLGLYGRGEARSAEFGRPGVIRVYCNVHASMSAYVVVVPDNLFARPAADGSFSIAGVPPGRYVLRAWHERATRAVEQEVVVGATGVADLTLSLDASGFRPEAHLNKYGQPYQAGGRRY